MKRLILLSILALAAGPQVEAQGYPITEWELSLAIANSDYGTDHVVPVGVHFGGWYSAHRYIRLGGEFAGEFKGTDIFAYNHQVRMRDYQFMVGPELVWRNRSRVTPFAHVLGGYATRHFNIPSGNFSCSGYPYPSCSEDEYTLVSDSGYGFAFGGGVDVKVHPNVSIRAFQFDYVRTHLDRNRHDLLPEQLPVLPSWQKSYRFTIGVVIHFGDVRDGVK